MSVFFNFALILIARSHMLDTQAFCIQNELFLLFLIQCQTCNRVGLEDQISISFGCNFAKKKSLLLLENYKSVKVIELIFNI